MVTQILQQVRQAIGNLNPQEVRDTAERRLAIRLATSSEESYREIEEYLLPPHFSRRKRHDLKQTLFQAEASSRTADIEIYEEGLPCPVEGFVYSHHEPERMVREILARKEEFGLPLARSFAPFRAPVTERVIFGIAKENAIFSLVTALPNIAPGILQLPWGVAEIGSDTAFLTGNQVRMMFLLAGASDRPIGYREQRTEVASVIAGAFGWRALARQLVGKIPLGGGLIPKAAVAFAGTYVVGKSTERLYRVGYSYTRDERRLAYEEAFARGKEIAKSFLDRQKPASV